MSKRTYLECARASRPQPSINGAARIMRATAADGDRGLCKALACALLLNAFDEVRYGSML